MPDRPKSFPPRMEEALAGWTLPVAVLSAALVVAVLHGFDVLSEETTAAVAVVAVAAVAGLFMLRDPGGPRRRDRALALAAAGTTVLAVVLPALPTVRPGQPLFAGELGVRGDAVPLPAGFSGRVRLLVSGRLPEGGEPRAGYTLGGAREPVEGKLERTYGQVRVGRSGRARVARDHVADWYDAVVPEGTKELTLDRVSGALGGRLRVEGHRPLLPFPAGPWVLAAVALGLASVADARLGRKNGVAVPAGMALAFALLVAFNATPVAAVGTILGGLLLGAIAGSLAGWIAALIARRLLPAPRRSAGTAAGARGG